MSDPIHFLRDEVMGVLEQMKTRNFTDSEQMKTVIDLACESILEQFVSKSSVLKALQRGQYIPPHISKGEALDNFRAEVTKELRLEE